MHSQADIALERHFPKLGFSLKDFQRQVINQVLDQGSTVAIMPTGGGKSLIYWVAGKALGGITLVISPLLALIDEQATKLEEQEASVLKISGGLSAQQQLKPLTALSNGSLSPDFLFASPEKIATDGYFEFCLAKRKADIKLIVIDEIHCVSQWGYDFRPFYKRIPDFLNSIFGEQWPPILGLTATVNPKELREIAEDFKIPQHCILKSADRLRFDVELKVEKFVQEDEKEARLWQLLRMHEQEKVIVYLYRKYRKRGVDDLAEKARAKGLTALSFHGDLSGNERQELLQQFRDGSVRVLFATNAFGMGIDIRDIRVVIHFMIPESVEQYYQEIGRAGRDGNGGTAYMLYSNKNIQVRRTHFIDKAFPNSDKLQEIYLKVNGHSTGLSTLQYFTDEEIQEALPYFLGRQLVKIRTKGFTRLNIFQSLEDPEAQELVGATRTGGIISTVRKTGRTPEAIFQIFYEAMSQDLAKAKRLDKCLIIDCADAALSETEQRYILEEIALKKSYKHGLLDYLNYLLDNYEDSRKLHQEIGRYLGVNKYDLGKIYKTKNGEWVRSKSEVIIANLLHEQGVNYHYEKPLYYTEKDRIAPDFTIEAAGTTWYWEHLGMLGVESYDQHWLEKKAIYEALKLNEHLITTEERSNLSAIVLQRLQEISAVANS